MSYLLIGSGLVTISSLFYIYKKNRKNKVDKINQFINHKLLNISQADIIFDLRNYKSSLNNFYKKLPDLISILEKDTYSSADDVIILSFYYHCFSLTECIEKVLELPIEYNNDIKKYIKETSPSKLLEIAPNENILLNTIRTKIPDQKEEIVKSRKLRIKAILSDISINNDMLKTYINIAKKLR